MFGGCVMTEEPIQIKFIEEFRVSLRQISIQFWGGSIESYAPQKLNGNLAKTIPEIFDEFYLRRFKEYPEKQLWF